MSTDRNTQYLSKGTGVTLGTLGTIGFGLSLLKGNTSGNVLGGLLGGQSDYDKAKADRGQQAETELNIVSNYVMPMLSQLSNIQTAVAVNAANNEKQGEITSLLFDAERRQTLSDFALVDAVNELKLERATCNTIKGTPMLSPSQLGEPYAAGTNYLVSRHVVPAEVVTPVTTSSCGTTRTTCGGITGITYTNGR